MTRLDDQREIARLKRTIKALDTVILIQDTKIKALEASSADAAARLDTIDGKVAALEKPR